MDLITTGHSQTSFSPPTNFMQYPAANCRLTFSFNLLTSAAGRKQTRIFPKMSNYFSKTKKKV